MPKQITDQDLLPILETLKIFPEGAALAEIETKLSVSIPRRTLQRHLSLLVKAGRIEQSGRKYHLPQQATSLVPAWQDDYRSVIRMHLLVPEQQRRIVSYNRDFLESYTPNESFYLSEKDREHLERVGKIHVPVEPLSTYAQNLFGKLLIDLSYNSSRLEGNTYSLLETKNLLENYSGGQGHTPKETQMIRNHADAIKFLASPSPDIGFNRYTILNLHALLANNLLRSEFCGSLRQRPVGIQGSSYQPPAVPQQIEEIFEAILKRASAIQNPFEQAFFALVHLPYPQPFEDVNKRVSRLAANIPLFKNHLCPVSFMDVQEKDYVDGLLGIYELNRIELLRDVFVETYTRSAAQYALIRQELGEPDPFKQKWAEQIKECVAKIVKDRNEGYLDEFMAGYFHGVRPNDEGLPKFRNAVREELAALHEGNIARFGISLDEFRAWKKTNGAG